MSENLSIVFSFTMIPLEWEQLGPHEAPCAFWVLWTKESDIKCTIILWLSFHFMFTIPELQLTDLEKTPF